MSAQLPGYGRAAEQHPAVPGREYHSLDGVLLGLAGDELVPVLAPGGRPADPDLGAVDDAGLPAGTQVVDDLGQGSQPHVGADGAASLGEQGPHLADGPGDGGAVHAEPAGQHVVCGPVTEMDESGQEPVDEHQPMLRTGTDRALSRSGRKRGLVPLVPQRTYLGYEFSDHTSRQAGDPAVSDDRLTCPVSRHPIMINDQALRRLTHNHARAR
jgi:hypothetical protein